MKIIEKLKHITNGGTEKVVFDNVSRINNEDMDFIVYSDYRIQSEAYAELVRERGIKHVFCDPKIAESKSPVKRITGKWFAFRKYVKEAAPDIVHIHLLRPTDVGFAIAARSGGCKRIFLHSHIVLSRKPVYIRFLYAVSKMLMPLFGTEYLACSHNAAEYMFPKSITAKKKYVFFPNGIEAEKFCPDDEKRKNFRQKYNLENKLVIGSVGRLAPEKNHIFLLDILAVLKKSIPHSVLVIAGDGKVKAQLEQRARELDISDNVILLGETKDISHCLCGMDIFLFPSQREGLGIAALEAQAAGLVTICSEAVPDAVKVTDLCHFMPKNASPQEWADKILSLRSYDRFSRAEEIKRSGFDISSSAALLEELYKKL